MTDPSWQIFAQFLRARRYVQDVPDGCFEEFCATTEAERKRRRRGASHVKIFPRKS